MIHQPDFLTLHFKKNRRDQLIDCTLQVKNPQKLKKLCSGLELELFFYPYHRQLKADHLFFFPYEEYAEDVNLGNPSRFAKIIDSSNKIFALIISSLLLFTFWLFKIQELSNLQSLAAVIATYVVVKEIWNDLTIFLNQISDDWPIKYKAPEFIYRLLIPDTLSKLQSFARRERYPHDTVMTDQFNLISHSNSKILALHFKTKTLINAGTERFHLLSIKTEQKFGPLLKSGWLMGIKIAYQKRWPLPLSLLQQNSEFFQLLENKNQRLKTGIKNPDDPAKRQQRWRPNQCYYKITYQLGRWKYYPKEQVRYQLQKLAFFS